jgi:hypothetical protein
MQDAKLIEWFLLEGSFRGVLAEQGHRLLPQKFTDSLDFVSRLRQVV